MQTSKKNELIIDMVYAVFSIAFYIVCRLFDNETIISYIILLEDIYLVYKCWKNHHLLISFSLISWFNYSILVANVLSPLPSYTEYRGTEELKQAIYYIFLLNTFLTFIFSRVRWTIVGSFWDGKDDRKSSIITYGIIFVLILLFIFSFDSTVTFGEERGTLPPAFEYSSILFILAFSYSRKGFQHYLIIFILLIYSATNLIFGGRITAMQLFIILFLVYLKPKTNLLKYFPVFIGIYMIFSLVGVIRGDIISNSYSLKDLFDAVFEDKLTLDTAYAAFYASVTFIKVDLITPLSQKMYLLQQYIIYLIIGGEVPDSNLPEYTFNFYPHSFGGVLPVYCSFYLGIIGIILIGLYLKFLFVKTNNQNRGLYMKVLSLYVVSTVPRWYLYSPTPLLRGIMLFSLCYGLCNIYWKLGKRNGKFTDKL